MASNKKSVVLYTDLIHTFEKLNDSQAGKLIKHFFRYVNDMNPKAPDKIIEIIFEPIKQQLKRDLKKWEAKRSKRVEAGKKGGIKSGESRRLGSKRSKSLKNEANEAVNVNDSVNVNANVIKRESIGAPDLKNSNLFRKPNIPTKQDVWEKFSSAGGTKEMAKAFYEKHESTGWFLSNSPITNFIPLVGKFIAAWKQNEKKKPEEAPEVVYQNINDLLAKQGK